MSEVRCTEFNWGRNFQYPNMVKVATIGDGSCMFHAIISSFFLPYRTGMLSGVPLDRREFVLKFRKELADKLGQPVDMAEPSIKWYDTLGRSQLSDFSKTVTSLTLESMQAELRAGGAVDNRFNEFISNVLNKDIYILDIEKQDIYVTGGDSDILYLNRDSIVLLYGSGHYELTGIKDPGSGVITLMFKPDDPFILAINQRLADILSH